MNDYRDKAVVHSIPKKYLSNRYCLHWLRVDIQSDNPRILSTVNEIVESLGLEPSKTNENHVDLRLRLSSGWQVLMPSEAQQIARQENIHAWIIGSRIYLTCGGHSVRLHPRAGVGKGVLPERPSSVRKDVLIYSLLLLVRRRGFYGLHASGVSREGAGYLFIGDRRSGKSTHTYSLVRQGWDYLGDDAVLLRSREGEVEGLALRRELSLDPALAYCFPELHERGHLDGSNGKGKIRLAVHALYPDRQINRCVPRVLLFPEITAGVQSRLVPMKPADALPRLIAQSLVFTLDPEVIPRHFRVLSQLARQARSYRLSAGLDLKENPELLAKLLPDSD